jgi:hypothetical protein
MRQRELARLRDQVDQLANDHRRQEHRLAKLKKDNDRLRQELDEARRLPHRQAGHFRRSKLKRRKKKSGRRPGHKAELRPTPTTEQIDRTLYVPCRLCPDCNVELVDPKIVVQYQTDLPPVVPIITQFNIETGYCPCCRQRVQGRHPEQISCPSGGSRS